MCNRVCFFLVVPVCCCVSAFSFRKSALNLKTVDWNVETFFDAHCDGTEYPEFRSSYWTRDAYTVRLDRLCRALITLDADVVIMEEIENPGVLYDMSNRMEALSWKRKLAYRYGCFASGKQASLGCAVLSRYPLSGMTIHSLDIRTESGTQPPMRPLMEVTVETESGDLKLFVNHWKSKVGGESGIWRIWQESVLGRRLACCTSKAFLACGDFNCDIGEFPRCPDIRDGANTVFRYVTPAGIGSIAVYSPWLAAGNRSAGPGSYYYRGRWERIDHFFTAGCTVIRDFRVETEGPWADRNGIPVAYRLRSGTGYSDHLPLSCRICPQ